MKPRWFVVLVVLAAAVETASAQTSKPKAENTAACPLFIQSDPPTPYGFAKANLASLWYARNAVKDALVEMKQAQDEQNSFAALTAMMRSTKISTNDFICAKQVVQLYASAKTHLTSATASQAENVQTAAQFVVIVYDQHIDINRRMLDLLKKISTSSKPTELSDQISTLQVERGARWADLVTPTTMAVMMLVDMRPTDDDGNFIKTTDPEVGHTKRLVITKKQKQELLDWADEHFPEFKDGTPRDQWSDPAKTATLYMTLFNGRKCSDE
jgi:hypothetical protein